MLGGGDSLIGSWARDVISVEAAPPRSRFVEMQLCVPGECHLGLARIVEPLPVSPLLPAVLAL